MADRLSAEKDNHRGLVLVRNPVGLQWEFEPPPCANPTALIGWVMREPDVEGGIPNSVAVLLANVLTRCATVSVLGTPENSNDSESNHLFAGETNFQVVKPTGIIAPQIHKGYPLVTTRNPEIVQTLLCDGDFSWSIKAQRIFLSAPDRLPTLSYEQIDTAFERVSTLNCDDLSNNANVLGLVVPAVDGDFAGIISFSPTFFADLISDLRAECDANHLTWTEVSEADFASTSWFNSNS